tara:strand:+ start:2383 stop:3771 length:1389 start_codon:yes stop_codon:yes gene_type:complete
MKYFLILVLLSVILISSCSKTTDDIADISSGDLPQTVANGLLNIDDLSQFRAIFKNMTLNNSDTKGGITILAPVNNALNNPIAPENLKDYIINGIVSPNEFTDGSTLKSISGMNILITVVNGQIFANGVMISTLPVASAANYSVYASSGLFITGSARYNDPHVNEYYVSYFENGVSRSLAGSYITTWPFVNVGNFPTPTSGSCDFPSFQSYSSGPSMARITFLQIEPFLLQLNRANLTTIPQEGSYFLSKGTYNAAQNINYGTCNLVINGAKFACGIGDDDAYVRVNVSEVKIDQTLGIEKRGYYKGTFDAILYNTDSSTPQKKVIAQGQFKVPMGGNETSPINGSVPNINLASILTVGKWYFTPSVQAEMQALNHECEACNLDDYIVFRANNTCDWSDGNIICPLQQSNGLQTGCIEHENNLPWALNSNQTVLTMGGVEFNILQVTENTINLDGLILSHGN